MLGQRKYSRARALARRLAGEKRVAVIAGVVKESAPGERRVAMVPGALSVLNKTGAQIVMESGAGEASGFLDAEYTDKGVKLAKNRAEVFAQADVILQVRSLGANPETGGSDLSL